MTTIVGLQVRGKLKNVRIGDEPGWEDKFQIRTILKYLDKNNYHHALVTKNGISFSTATLTEYETVFTQKDAAYAERNKCVALIARMAIALILIHRRDRVLKRGNPPFFLF